MTIALPILLGCLAVLCWGCFEKTPDPDFGSTDDPTELSSDTVPNDGGQTSDNDLELPVRASATYILNPYGSAPLVAIAKVTHADLHPADTTEIKVTVQGRDDRADDLTALLHPQSDAFEINFSMRDKLDENEVGIPILGLYPDHENIIHFVIRTDARIFFGDMFIQTDPLPLQQLETTTVSIIDMDNMEPGWTYLNGRVYDHSGICRWYGPQILNVLANGNILESTNEINWLGAPLSTRRLPENLSLHHDAIELPNGNIAACVNNSQTTIMDADGNTVPGKDDYVVELDKETGEIVNAWDFRQILDVTRRTVGDVPEDWLHMNTLCYDAEDDTLLMSGRFQGIVKMTRGDIQGSEANAGKSLKWILAPHLDWGLAGPEGEGPLDPNDYLLTAVDADGVPYPEAVQDNLAPPAPNPDVFTWPVGQHGLQITSSQEGRLSFLTFNNQASFIFDGPGTTGNGVTWGAQGDLSNDRAGGPYSQIVEYEVDEVHMTVKQIWSFGEHQPDLYGSFNSGVTLLKKTQNRLMVSNGMDQHDQEANPYNPLVIEVTPEGETVYRLEITNTEMSAYRAGRVDLYHPMPDR